MSALCIIFFVTRFVCNLLWLRTHLALMRAERKMKQLEQNFTVENNIP
ncbi:MAG: hypothetical protein HNEKOMLI_00547 [Sodalis sp. Psp]|nr:hypothetical protein [Sodalis sp. Psp]MCR3757019.1 hypothetical protein [Sodalis sp. Ppy]